MPDLSAILRVVYMYELIELLKMGIKRMCLYTSFFFISLFHGGNKLSRGNLIGVFEGHIFSVAVRSLI